MIYIVILCNSTESLQNRSTILPCSLDPMPLPQYGALWWRRSQGTKLYCLVNRCTLGVNNLPRVVAQIMPRLESNPRPLDHKSDVLPLYYRAIRWGRSRRKRRGGGWEGSSRRKLGRGGGGGGEEEEEGRRRRTFMVRTTRLSISMSVSMCV